MIIYIVEKRDKISIYKSSETPRVGELIKLPHRGLFKVVQIVRYITDDLGFNKADNHELWIDVFVEKVNDYEEL